MPHSKAFKALVYPIRGRFVFEVEDIENLRAPELSGTYYVGRSKWSVAVSIERSERTNFEKTLFVYLMCLSKIQDGKVVDVTRKVHLINQLKTGDYEGMERGSGYTNENKSWEYMVLKWPKLMSGGYVKDGKIIIDHCFIIKSEDGIEEDSIDFTQPRPTERHLRMMMDRNSRPSTVERFEGEFNVSDISEIDFFAEPVVLFGLSVQLKIRTIENDETWLAFCLCFNEEDTSEWWMCRTRIEFELVDQNDEDRSVCKTITHLFQASNSMVGLEFIKWDALVNPCNGYVKNGKFKVQVFLRIVDAIGFEEEMRRGIETPMRHMTDTELARHSAHFRGLFSSNDNNGFHIVDVKSDVFIRFLELVFCGGTSICEENAEELLECIDRFEAPECLERCDMLLSKLELKNTLKVLEWVDKYSLSRLRRKTFLKIKDDKVFKPLYLSSQYKSMSAEQKKSVFGWKLIADRMKEGHRNVENYFKRTAITNVEIIVDGRSYHTSKQILSNSSYFFMERFYGPYSMDELTISDIQISSELFETLLMHIYFPMTEVTAANVGTLFKLADEFVVLMLFDKCEEYLVLNDSVPLIDKLEYAGKYELPYLLEDCMKLKNTRSKSKMAAVQTHRKYSQLPSYVTTDLERRIAFLAEYFEKSGQQSYYY